MDNLWIFSPARLCQCLGQLVAAKTAELFRERDQRRVRSARSVSREGKELTGRCWTARKLFKVVKGIPREPQQC